MEPSRKEYAEQAACTGCLDFGSSMEDALTRRCSDRAAPASSSSGKARGLPDELRSPRPGLVSVRGRTACGLLEACSSSRPTAPERGAAALRLADERAMRSSDAAAAGAWEEEVRAVLTGQRRPMARAYGCGILCFEKPPLLW
eukprot:scaffold185172_cov30-Tisochrysis_lutea.AAC.3